MQITLLQLIVVMASHCYLVGPSGESFVEYLVRHCALMENNESGMVSKEISPLGKRSRLEVLIWAMYMYWKWFNDKRVNYELADWKTYSMTFGHMDFLLVCFSGAFCY